MDFWGEANVFNPNQFSYMKGRSTVTQLLFCFNDWAKSRNKRNPTDVILLDFSKAFDIVPHRRLLHKLERYGIDGPLLKWFESFLIGRSQRVVLRGSYSSWTQVKSSVPQGTILGPILFISYVNDISTGASSTVKLYADDTKLYREIESIPDDTDVLQSDLFRLTEWCKTWQLKFNPDKCETMRITHKQDTSKESYTLDPNGEVLKNVKSIKDLGITISYDLSWSDHIRDVVKKANRVLGVIKRVLGSKSITEFSLPYKSLVRPILEYAAPVWCPFLVKDIVLLEKVQRRASRLALGQKRGEMHYKERCTILKWSPLEK